MAALARLGEPAPAFALPDLEGALHAPAAARGRILVLNFWSAECPWSARADEELLALRQGWGEGVALWWIASNADEAEARRREVAAARGLAPLLHDDGSQVADVYGAGATPHLFVIDAAGVLRYAGGLDEATFRRRDPGRRHLAEAVAALLRGQLPEVAETLPYGCAIVRPG